MSTIDIDKYKNRLLEWRQRLQGEVKADLDRLPQTTQPPGDVPDASTHSADQDVEGLEQEIVVSTAQRDILAAVEAALERIEAGKFGKCEHCGMSISTERLDAIPYTPWCLHCAEAAEG